MQRFRHTGTLGFSSQCASVPSPFLQQLPMHMLPIHIAVLKQTNSVGEPALCLRGPDQRA